MKRLRVLVVEDEAPARRKLRRLLASEPGVEVAGEAGEGEAAWRAVTEAHPDVVLLDVNIPPPDGLAIAGRIAGMPAPRPEIIFLTAHDDHAVEAFALRAADYLLKPYAAERLHEALARVRERLPPEARPERLAVDTGERQVMVACSAITRIEAAGNYVEVHAGGRPLLTRATLESVAEQLDPAAFVRVNRSTVVAVAAMAELQRRAHGELRVRLHDGSETMWTRRYRQSTGPLVPALGRLIPKD